MNKTSVQIVQEYYEQVINLRHFDRIYDYCIPLCIMHSAPYIGFGLNFDDRSEDHIRILDVAPDGPSHGKLRPGDELVRVKGETKTWEGHEELKNSVWALGLLGDHVTFTVRRNEKLVDVPVVRGPVDEWDMHLSTFAEVWFDELRTNWPDLKSEIKLIFGLDNLVACFVVNSGTNLKYHRTASWGECSIYRLSNGKIVEQWGAEDGVMQLKQLGYRIAEPEKEMA